MDTHARHKQIKKIAQNARTTWFGLLALLVFVGVTLMGHKDSDVFAFGRHDNLVACSQQKSATGRADKSRTLIAREVQL